MTKFQKLSKFRFTNPKGDHETVCLTIRESVSDTESMVPEFKQLKWSIIYCFGGIKIYRKK